MQRRPDVALVLEMLRSVLRIGRFGGIAPGLSARGMGSRGPRLALFISACLGAACVCPADIVWNGSAGADWFTADNWTPAQVPTNGDAVIIDAGAAPSTNVILSADTANLASLTISNAVLMFTNWTTTLNATNVTIRDRGVFTLPAAFTNNVMSNRVHVVCSNFCIETGGVVNANAKGYGTDSGLGKGTYVYGAGSGGGYGGPGSPGNVKGCVGGGTYGSTNEPLAPGSGGTKAGDGNMGSPGGGAVRIEASSAVTIDGTVTANGGNTADAGAGAGAGSGGAIFITCGTFGGGTTGVLRANGGTGNTVQGAGGGGRIAVQYAALAGTPGIRFSTSPGAAGPFSSVEQWWIAAGRGTLFLADAGLLSETLTDNRFTDVRLYMGGFKNWTVANLSVSNCSLDLAENGFQLVVSNDLTIGTQGYLGIGADSGSSNTLLACGGNIVLTNGGCLGVYSGATNAPLTYGALVSVTSDVRVYSNSWIYPYSHNVNGGSALFRMRNLAIATNAGFHAVGRGYAAAQGPGKGAGASRGAGGGYGGKGGMSSFSDAGGNPYGSTNAPIDPGSGSGTANGRGAQGGGSVRVEAADRITVDGKITANGGAFVTSGGTYFNTGGGAGGGIYLQCATLEGSGTILADGGVANTFAGGGGGGRIALWVRKDRFTGETPGTYVEYAGSANGRISVDGATGYQSGTNGTFYLWVIPPPQGTVFFIR